MVYLLNPVRLEIITIQFVEKTRLTHAYVINKWDAHQNSNVTFWTGPYVLLIKIDKIIGILLPSKVAGFFLGP
jgi:hypothetical protein